MIVEFNKIYLESSYLCKATLVCQITTTKQKESVELREYLDIFYIYVHQYTTVRRDATSDWMGMWLCRSEIKKSNNEQIFF
jgi:hypothetical protein